MSTNSKLLSWPTAFEWLKGLIMAVGTPLLYFLQEALPSMGLEPWQKIAISALVTYILKQFITNSEGKILKREDRIYRKKKQS